MILRVDNVIDAGAALGKLIKNRCRAVRVVRTKRAAQSAFPTTPSRASSVACAYRNRVLRHCCVGRYAVVVLECCVRQAIVSSLHGVVREVGDDCHSKTEASRSQKLQPVSRVDN